MELSKRQTECLKAIDAFMKLRKFAPTNSEIAEAMGIKFTFGVRKHLDRLQFKGAIVRIPYGIRSIRITEEGHSFLQAVR